MADQLDLAADYEEMDRQHAIAAHHGRSASLPKLAPVGYCRNPLCGDDVQGSQLYCNDACADKHHRLTNR